MSRNPQQPNPPGQQQTPPGKAKARIYRGRKWVDVQGNEVVKGHLKYIKTTDDSGNTVYYLE